MNLPKSVQATEAWRPEHDNLDDAQTWDIFAPIYEQLLTHCSPCCFPPPWDFLSTPEHCRGPVADPAAALGDLRARCDDETLQAAKVLSTSAEEGLHLSPRFTGPGALLIPLRGPRDGTLQGLLTARGCLPTYPFAIEQVQKDHWTCEALLVTGVLFATPNIQEVALLRALGLPATLSLDLHRLPLSGLHRLNDSFADNPPPRSGALLPSLALVGWSPLSLAAQPPPELMRAVTHLTQAREHLKMELAGVGAWRLGAADLENLRFRVKLRNARLIQQLLRHSADTLEDVATLLPPREVVTPSPEETGRAFAAAQADLLAQLADPSPWDALSDGARRAREAYEKLVQHKLIEPLRIWALASRDAVLRNVGIQLTEVCQLLHGMSPLLLTLQARQLQSALAGASEPLPTQMFAQYLALIGRLGNLIRDLCQWRQR